MEELQTQKLKPLSVQDWALTIFISGLPIVGLIMLLIWAFSDDTNIHKKNWSKGSLLIMIIFIALFFVFMFIFGGMALITNIFNN